MGPTSATSLDREADLVLLEAMTAARITPGERVVVIGDGPLGTVASDYARSFAAEVLGMRSDTGVDAVRRVNDHGGADVVVVLSPTTDTLQRAFECLRPRGRLVCPGLPPGDAAAG